MDNQQQPSKWDELARELGAEAPPEPVIVPKSTQSAERGTEEPRRTSAVPPPRPKPSPQSWDNLAADLGLEVPPPPPPPPAPPAPSHAPAEVPTPRAAVSQREDDRPPRRPRPPRREEPADAEDRPPRPPRQQRDETPRRDRGQRPRRGRDETSRRDREDAPRRGREQSPRRDREELPRQAPELPPPAAPEPEIEAKQAPSLGVSLWHKIFGSPDEQAERIAESTGSLGEERPAESRHAHEDRQGQPHAERPSDRGAEETTDASDSWRAESVEVEFVDTENAEDRAARPTDESGDPRRRRRRRGRGRGRGRRPDGEHREPGGEERPAGLSEAETDGPRDSKSSRTQREPKVRSGRSSRPRREAPRNHDVLKDDLDDGLEEIVLDDDDETDEMDLGIDGEEAGDATQRSTPAGHKSIPSWDEAIGMIVDANLATRTDRRRSSSPPGRGSGPARGRARGGRRRKKS